MNTTGRTATKRGIRMLVITILAVGSGQALGEPTTSQKENFHSLKTDHFTVRYDTSDETIRPLTIELEKTYDAVARFCLANKLGSLPQGTRLDVIVFEHPEAFARHLAAIGAVHGSIAGLYDHRSNVAAFLNISNNPDIRRIEERITLLQDQLQREQTAQRENQQDRPRTPQTAQDIHALRAARDELILAFNRLVIRHETAHQVLFNFGVHRRGVPNPSWVTEGLACQFEIPQNAAGHLLGAINHARLADFREALRVAPATQTVDHAAIDHAITTGRLLALPELIADRTALEGAGPNAPFRYAQAWALVRYLMGTRPDDFARYLRHLSQRKAEEAIDPLREWTDFTSIFGEPDSDFRRSWIEYILQLPLDPAWTRR